MRRIVVSFALAFATFFLLVVTSDAATRGGTPVSVDTVPQYTGSTTEPLNVTMKAVVAQKATNDAAWYTEAKRQDDERQAYAAAHPHRTPSRRSPSGSGGHRGYGSVEECIAAVENGGDYGRSSNPSHFGKYQYDQQTWESHGGDPDTWGYATPEEQERVFRNGVDQYGYGAWTPWDGCG